MGAQLTRPISLRVLTTAHAIAWTKEAGLCVASSFGERQLAHKLPGVSRCRARRDGTRPRRIATPSRRIAVRRHRCATRPSNRCAMRIVLATGNHSDRAKLGQRRDSEDLSPATAAGTNRMRQLVTSSRVFLEFAGLHLDMQDECLWRGGQMIQLQRKTFAVLRYLAE